MIFLIALTHDTRLNAQFFTPSDSLNQKRLYAYITAGTIGYTGTMICLDQLWYDDYKTSKFHFFNDNGSWLQMDKLGHALTSYQVGRLAYESMKWTGVSEKPALWIGGNVGLFFLTSVEILDGYSSGWGFSYGDMLANVTGTGLFISQQVVWHEQRLTLKFSYSSSEFAQYRSGILGDGGLNSLLKDYNGQTIWLSVNPSSFFNAPKPILPWLSVSFGYSGNGMLGGDINPIEDSNGNLLPAFTPYRQYLLSLDVDLQRIPTKSHFLKTIFSVVGFIKIPAPAIELSQDQFKWHWLYF